MALRLTKQVTHDFPMSRVLLLGVTETPSKLQQYVEAGASGYVLKDAPFHELQAVLEGVGRGETVCSPYIAHAMFTRLSELAETSSQSGSYEPGILSDRELEILLWMAEGWSNRQIAEHLCLSPHTVKNHVHNILKKLRVQRRLEAIKYATERQWFEKDGQAGRTGLAPAFSYKAPPAFYRQPTSST
jgi:two-component system response regulator NreC